ncbi:MAG: nuclear transport factor 2 family protein [Sphingobium sp.]
MTTATDHDDRIAISEVKARYCRFLDTKQWDAWGALFTEDFVLDTSAAGGPAPIIGRDAAVATVRRSIETARTAHQVHTPEIAIDGDTADAIWAMQDRVVFDNGHGLVGYGHYTERYVKQGGQWRIASSKLTRLHLDRTAPQDE